MMTKRMMTQINEATVRERKSACGENDENSKLIAAFQARYIHLHPYGTRLPQNYTVVLRLSSSDMAKQSTAKQKDPKRSQASPGARTPTTSDDEADPADMSVQEGAGNQELDTDTEEDEQTRATNAYPGCSNDIGSIHQRRWFLQLDRQNSGFQLETSGSERGRWTGGFKPFLVRGRITSEAPSQEG
jgi:hypothetical protein